MLWRGRQSHGTAHHNEPRPLLLPRLRPQTQLQRPRMPAVVMATGTMKTMNVVVILLLIFVAGAALLLMAAVAVPMVAAAAVARAERICRRTVGHISRRRRHIFGLFAGSFGPEVWPVGAATAAPVQSGLEFAGGGAGGPLV
jgi:hypothetical protein